MRSPGQSKKSVKQKVQARGGGIMGNYDPISIIPSPDSVLAGEDFYVTVTLSRKVDPEPEVEVSVDAFILPPDKIFNPLLRPINDWFEPFSKPKVKKNKLRGATEVISKAIKFPKGTSTVLLRASYPGSAKSAFAQLRVTK